MIGLSFGYTPSSRAPSPCVTIPLAQLSDGKKLLKLGLAPETLASSEGELYYSNRRLLASCGVDIDVEVLACS